MKTYDSCTCHQNNFWHIDCSLRRVHIRYHEPKQTYTSYEHVPTRILDLVKQAWNQLWTHSVSSVKVVEFLPSWFSLAHDPIFGERGRAKQIVYQPCMMFCVSLFYESMHMGPSQVCIFLYVFLVLTLRLNMIFLFTKRNMCMCLCMVLPVHQ